MKEAADRGIMTEGADNPVSLRLLLASHMGLVIFNVVNDLLVKGPI